MCCKFIFTFCKMVQISLFKIIGLDVVVYTFGPSTRKFKDSLVHIVSSNPGKTAEWDPVPKHKIKMMGVGYMPKISGNKWEMKVVMPHKGLSVWTVQLRDQS